MKPPQIIISQFVMLSGAKCQLPALMELFNLRLVSTAQVKMNKVLVKCAHSVSHTNACCGVAVVETMPGANLNELKTSV